MLIFCILLKNLQITKQEHSTYVFWFIKLIFKILLQNKELETSVSRSWSVLLLILHNSI